MACEQKKYESMKYPNLSYKEKNEKEINQMNKNISLTSLDCPPNSDALPRVVSSE